MHKSHFISKIFYRKLMEGSINYKQLFRNIGFNLNLSVSNQYVSQNDGFYFSSVMKLIVNIIKKIFHLLRQKIQPIGALYPPALFVYRDHLIRGKHGRLMRK